jgi:hypothetical protein
MGIITFVNVHSEGMLVTAYPTAGHTAIGSGIRISLQIECHELSPLLFIELDIVYFGSIRKEIKPCRISIRRSPTETSAGDLETNLHG